MARKNKYETHWTERKLQYALYREYAKANKYFCRNKYVFNGPGRMNWESDAYMQARSLLSTEFECKVSRSDWTKEQKEKERKHRFLKEVWLSEGENLKNPRWKPENKRSKEFQYFCPNYFYITCQEGLISPEEVEAIFPYAGLKWVTEDLKVKTKLRKKLHPVKQDMHRVLLDKFFWRTNTLEITLYDFKKKVDALSTNTMSKKEIQQFLKKCKI